MKNRIAASWFVVVLLAVGMVATASAQQAPTLTINPLAVTMMPDTSKFFEASFSDGTLATVCKWSATGLGENGVSLTTTGRSWAVFYDGTKQGANYVISATCKNSVGNIGTAHAYVFVR